MPMILPMTKQKLEILKLFQKDFGQGKIIAFDEFIHWALYSQSVGYYRRKNERVGRSETSDFYTSTSMGSVWGEMILCACETLLYPQKVTDFTFYEIAAEPDSSALDGVVHKFKEAKTLRLGDKIEFSGPSIIYSNEWLDAQPFRRFKFDLSQNLWIEMGVSCNDEGIFEKKMKPASNSIAKMFKNPNSDGYTIDWPSGANKALEKIVSKKNWYGLFLTFDYGIDFSTMITSRPEGTARGYRNHKLINNILERIGEQDITCHLCWDSLKHILEQNEFFNISLERQESFFMKNASTLIEKIIANKGSGLNTKLLSIKELIHPQHLGSKFQALYAMRS